MANSTDDNPIEPSLNLEPVSNPKSAMDAIHPQKTLFDEDSAITKAEKYERHDINDIDHLPSKRIKLDQDLGTEQTNQIPTQSERWKGVTPIKEESVSHNV